MSIYKEHKTEILEAMIEHLKTLPPGTETTTYELICVLFPEWKELIDPMWLSFELLHDFERMAKKAGLYLDMSKHDGLVEGLPCGLDFAVYQKKPGKKCPYCGNRDTAEILYGYPMFSEELEQDLANHRISLGGCCIGPMNPKYHCFGCKKDFGKPGYFETKSGRESYEKAITEIKFERGGFFQGKETIVIKKQEDKYLFSKNSLLEAMTGELSEKRWNALIKRLYGSLYIHEWKKNYNNPEILDGEQWSLEIKLTGKRVRNIWGSNDYPPYWEELVRTFKKLEKDIARNEL